ncbi:hypothetical protein R1sor_024596 [Riccia sorocarpa]|uniref:SET domain-containing protein n=1 Tax=Riccia sorocarpa TaxID=122646 RepID=A0ABD3GU63_9MARC
MDTGCVFAYTRDGCLKEEFLQYEMDMAEDEDKLKTSSVFMGCGNRVIQRGITCKLQIFFTHDGKGWGLRTLDQLPAGAFVCECVGEILTNMEQEERNNNAKADPTVTHTYGARKKGLKDEDALCLDATFSGNMCLMKRVAFPKNVASRHKASSSFKPFSKHQSPSKNIA